MKKYSAKTLGLTAFFSALTALFFACRFDLPQKTQAITDPPSSSSSGTTNNTMGFPNLTEMVKRVNPAVVNISSIHVVRVRPQGSFGGRGDPFSDDFFGNFFGVPREYNKSSLGTGFIIDKDGTILTNNHVVQNADEIDVKLSDGRKFEAKVVGTDPKSDLAVIKIKSGGEFPTVPLGNSDQLEVGEWVVAVGNPFGLGQTVTTGIVSAKGRVIGAGPYDDFIQTDASINPGNSGGPLFNLKGEVIGINTAIIASGQGIGFAIPVNVAKNLAPQLIQNGKVSRGYLGVGIQEMTPELAKSFNLSSGEGVLISGVYPGGPADRVGIEAGDIVTSFNGKPVRNSHDLPLFVSQTPIGSKVAVEVLRKGEKKSFTVEVGALEGAEKQMTVSKESSSALGLVVREPNANEIQSLDLKGRKGVVVTQVLPGSQAEWVGLQGGDVILEINNVPMNGLTDYNETLKKIRSGDVVRIFVKRGEMTTFFAFKK